MVYKRRIIVGLAGMLVLCAQNASARDGLYVSTDAGAFFHSADSFTTTIANSSGLSDQGTNRLTYQAGPQFGLAIGGIFTRNFRVEAEFDYATYRLSSTTPTSLNGVFPNFNGQQVALASGGHRDTFSGTLNGFFDVPVQGIVQPFIGGGLGLAHSDASTGKFIYPNKSVFTSFSAGADRAIALCEICVALRLIPQLTLSPAYRYTRDFTANERLTLAANSARIEARYRF